MSYFVICGIPACLAALGWTECLLGVAAALCLVVVGYTLLKSSRREGVNGGDIKESVGLAQKAQTIRNPPKDNLSRELSASEFTYECVPVGVVSSRVVIPL